MCRARATARCARRLVLSNQVRGRVSKDGSKEGGGSKDGTLHKARDLWRFLTLALVLSQPLNNGNPSSDPKPKPKPKPNR